MSSNTQGVDRRLTVILAADAVGYSKAMSRDEEGTIRVLEGHRALIDPLIVSHGGRIISTAGDSVLAEFTSAVAAVRCATEMQESLKTRNEKLPEDKRMYFRVGVNLGDVVVKGQDLLGDGVNVAARLESIAEPGGVCIASSVYDQITGKLDLGFVDMGEQQLKNITRPIRTYQVSGARPVIVAAGPAQATTVAPSETPRRGSLAPYVIGFLVFVIVGAVVLGAIAWDRGWIGQERKWVPLSGKALEKAQSTDFDLLSSAPAPTGPGTPAAPGPKTDPTFAALAAGEAVQPRKGAASNEWIATFACEAFKVLPPSTTRSRASFRDGEFVIEAKVRDTQDYWRISGRPRGNELELTGSLVSPRPTHHPKAGFWGGPSGDGYSLKGRLENRDCTLTLAPVR
jgi:class 3 adenylate cyclase